MRFLERLAALVLLVLWMPVLGVIAFIIAVTSPGPAIYRQIRIGKGEKLFTIYKLRTMLMGGHSGRVIDPQDPRITKVGRFLRKTRIDEVPQLWNIVLGEMVFVGPRPHNRAGSRELRANFGKRYTNRYLLKPGIYGLTQLLWSRKEGYRRLIACDELFRIRKSRSLVTWILWKSLSGIFQSKTF